MEKKQIAKVAQNVVFRMETNPLLMSDDQWKRLEIVASRALKSGVLPKAIDTIEKAFIVALKGIELGLQPMYALEHINVINGKATISGQAMLRLIYERCPGAKIECMTQLNKQHEECEMSFQRPGQKEQRVKFTMHDAQNAGLLAKGGPWKTYPKAMLRWRAVADGARSIFPDIIGGLYLPEEMGAEPFIEAEVSKQIEFIAESELLVHAPSLQVDQPPPPTSISDQARKLLWATARNCNWTKDDVHNYLEFETGKVSTKDLTGEELSALLKRMEANVKEKREDKEENKENHGQKPT